MTWGSAGIHIITVVKFFKIWVYFEHMENQHTLNLLCLPNVRAKTTQIGRLFCNNKMTFCVNDKCYVNFLRNA